MGLNFGGGGDYMPHIRYMASTSSWAMSTENGAQPFQFTQAIFDLENIQTGWGSFVEGQAPSWVMDENLTTPAARPQSEGHDYKRGFKVTVYSKTMFGDQPNREFATTATGACLGIEALYNEYEEKKVGNEGKVPVVEFSGSVPQKVGKGNTTVPTLKIVKFVDRPVELGLGDTQAQPVAEEAPKAVASGGASEF